MIELSARAKSPRELIKEAWPSRCAGEACPGYYDDGEDPCGGGELRLTCGRCCANAAIDGEKLCDTCANPCNAIMKVLEKRGML